MDELRSVHVQMPPRYEGSLPCVHYTLSPPEGLNNGHMFSSAPSIANGGLLVKKVPNNSLPGVVDTNNKRPMVLSHLPSRPPVDIQFTDLTYSVSEGRKRGFNTILKGVNGKFRSGELTAIMGPSGAGKSTLMNSLAGYKTSHLTGSVRINGKERQLRRFRKMSCYIMQDDQLLPHLTVLEAMNISANLKLGKDTSRAEKKVVVEEILEMLGLAECSNTRTSNLSGGQRKRLSIALELVNNPPVMFFDEPTSGLDSASCFQCLSLLKSLARGGRTIICTIHQPSARLFEMFDHLYILAEGQCIYQGSVQGLVPFLSSLGFVCPGYHNPADYVMEVACGEHGECVYKLVMAVKNIKCNNLDLLPAASPCAGTEVVKSTSGEKVHANGIPAPGPGEPVPTTGGVNCTTSLLDSDESLMLGHSTGFPTSGLLQFYILLKRTFLSTLRDKTLTLMRLLSHAGLGILIGMIYFGIGNDASKVISNSGCIFASVLFLTFNAMMPTILTFPVEMGVFMKEHLNYWYSLKSFYFAKTMADLPLQSLCSIVYVTVVYFMTSQPHDPLRFIMVLNMCVLTSLVAQSLGLLVGAGMSIENGIFFGPASSVPIILFSGFFVNFNALPTYMQWLPYISYVRYGFEGTMVAIYGHGREKLKCSEAYCHFKNPKKFLEEMDMGKAEYWIDAVALVGFFVGIRFITYWVFRMRLHAKR
ncbi:ATP-binding cassette sub-family G member 4 [Anabrus simplex]|uniref:ATP-binding cassette sub-family G member 4 n=1 Tax=Anabrus simplex TaxID=316456 RepID=UPI0034DD12D9